jgi:hypothetical protein
MACQGSVPLETPDIISALPTRRSELQKAIAHLQRQERKHKAEMM